MMRVGVTGGLGFIGRYVVNELQERGYDVAVLDRYHRGDYGGLKVFLGDTTDATAMQELAAHVDGVIHLAGILGTQETIKNPYPTIDTNIKGGVNFLEAISAYSIPGATITVGNWWMNNPYSITKNMVERFCRMYNDYRGAKVNVIRALNAYGPGQAASEPYGPAKVRKIIPAFMCRALSGTAIEVYGDGQQISDMVYVSDVAKALVNAFEYACDDEILANPVEIGPDEHMTVLQTAQAINGAVADLGFAPVPIKHLPMRPGETPGEKVTADTRTLHNIGMTAQQLVPFNDGIKETAKWYLETKGTEWR